MLYDEHDGALVKSRAWIMPHHKNAGIFRHGRRRASSRGLSDGESISRIEDAVSAFSFSSISRRKKAPPWTQDTVSMVRSGVA